MGLIKVHVFAEVFADICLDFLDHILLFRDLSYSAVVIQREKDIANMLFQFFQVGKPIQTFQRKERFFRALIHLELIQRDLPKAA